jgi:hypothetical protein
MSPAIRSAVLFAAGDPGGANAVLPVALRLAAEGRVAAAVLDHGHLGRAAPPGLDRVAPPDDGEDLSGWLSRGGFSAVCFGTSLTDRLPLELARAARRAGLPVMCVLDNWMNYRIRLGMDGAADLVPDLYAVMDEAAEREALAEGVPASCLRVSGHPGLAALAGEVAAAAADGWRQEVRRRLGLGLDGRMLLAFVGEPVAHDQGTGPENPGWRGYTEDDVLPLLCRHVRNLAGEAVDVVIVPHPRDDRSRLEALWRAARGGLGGGLAPPGMSGRQIVMAADRVVGMASILLYESWLQGKPTLSLQPGLVRDDLKSVARRPGVVFVGRAEDAAAGIGHWLRLTPGPVRPDLDLHRQAPRMLADWFQSRMDAADGTD